MVKINLFPIEEIKRKYQIKMTIVGNVATLIIVALCFTGIYFVNSSKIRDIQTQISLNKKKLKELKSLQVQLKRFEKDKKILQTKLKIIKELESFKLMPSYIMYVFSENIPDKLWLRKFEDKDTKISLSGIAIDEPTIVEFMNNLKHTKIFNKIELIQVSQFKIANYKFKTFSVEIEINKNKIKSIM